MSLRVPKFVLMGKIETTYGDDPTLAVADDVITTDGIPTLTKEFNAQNIRRGDKSFFYKNLPGIQLATLAFDVPLTIATANGVAGEVTKLLTACCWGVKTAETNQFDALGEPETLSSMYIEFYNDGVKEILSGARGVASFRFESGTIPIIHFEFTGIYNSDSAVAVPTVVSFKHGTLYVVKAGSMKIATVNYHSSLLEFTDGNIISPIKDASATEGIYQVQVSDCEPRGTINALVDTAANAGTLEGLVENATASDILYEAVPAGAGDAKNPVITLSVIFESFTRESDENILRYSMPFVITAIDLDIEKAV